MAGARGLVDPDDASRPRRLQHCVSSVNQLAQTDRMVADFMATAREMLAGGVDQTSLNAVGRLLSEVSREPGFVPRTEMKSLHGGDTTSAVLQTDPDGLTLMLGKFSPKEETPVHNQRSWGVPCAVQGRAHNLHGHPAAERQLKVVHVNVP